MNGKQIVIVNDIRFKGKRNIDWDEVKQYLKQYVGEFIEITENKRFQEIWKENIAKMQNMAGIDIIPDLQYQFLMKIMMFCCIIYFMQSW